MCETLYQTDKPKESVSECYELCVQAHPGDDTDTYDLIEMHGWWDEKLKRYIHARRIFCPEEGLPYEEAHEMYRALRIRLAQNGFVHVFRPDYFSGKEYEYEQIVLSK